ncbi:BTB/POZ protein [Penicillium hordei]|uniref:BTB/POZ protein n=1 Tax=Penicillium hordei TaxID=40994 RepID=A0AAD6EHS6_9EURO|nr:BTB/POZ protein [Penicillium hordei]KAJ5617572.1 BTB/POZ protein [Penicillium hordei]
MSGDISGFKHVMPRLASTRGINSLTWKSFVNESLSNLTRLLFAPSQATSRAQSVAEDNPETIERVLSFLYLREYNEAPNPEDKSNDTEPKEIPLNNIEVFITADKFGIEPLKSLATQKFSRWATANWNSLVFPDVAHEVMNSVPSHESSLREIIVDVISTHITDLIERPEILHLLDSFGCLGSLTIANLVQNGLVKHPKENDVFKIFTQKLISFAECRKCCTPFDVGLKFIEYETGVFRCASCGARH